MTSCVVTMSPQGQFTIPMRLRKLLNSKKYFLELRGDVIVLRPCKLMMNAKDSFVQKKLVAQILKLNIQQRLVFDLIRQGPCSPDFLLTKTSFNIGQLSTILNGLELAGLTRLNRDFLWETVDLN